MIRRALLVTVLVGALGLSACSSGGSDSKSTTTLAPIPVKVPEVLQGIADDVIVPSYEHLSTSLTDLNTATEALCAEPSEANLTAAQEAWKGAATAWQGTRGSGVGPALDARLASDVGFAARATVIDDLLEGSDPVDEDAMSEEGAAARGIYASEIALFGEGSDTLTTAEGARRCQYATSVSALAWQAADAITTQWTEGDAVQTFVDGLDGTPQSSIDAVVNEMSHRLEELDMMGLRDMTTAKTVDDLDPTRVGGPAQYRLADRKALLHNITDTIGDGSSGISALVGAKDAGTMKRLVAASDKADAKVDALPDSVQDALEDPAAVKAAFDAVNELKVLLTTEVASKLGVTITFSDSDGDS